MKKSGKPLIGGIERKIVSLILVAMLVVAGAILAVTLTQSRMLSRLAAETTERQLSSITDTTTAVIDSVIDESMDRTTALEARVTDEMFQDLVVRVQMMGDYAQKLFDDPDSFPRMPYARPEAARTGTLSAQVLLADGVEASALDDRLGLIANMSDMMLSLCSAYETDNVYIALPEGATLAVNTVSGDWVRADGSYVSFDPRTRYWYRQAVESGERIFTDVETDQATGEMCVTCALPVYSADGTLQAVASADLFLTEMQRTVAESTESGGYLMVINQDGHVIISPDDKSAFPVMSSADADDLRDSDNGELAALVRDALQGRTGVRRIRLGDEGYFMTGVPMKTVGWALIAVCSEALAGQPAEQLRENYQRIQEEATAVYRDENARSKTVLAVSLAGLLIVMIGGALVAGRRIAKPLNTITGRIAELQEGDLEFRMEDAYRTGDEVEALARSFADISHKTVEYLAQIQRVTAEKERISTELDVARKIQESMLPGIFPPYPGRDEFDLYASMDPAKEVGGDFYDFFLIDADHLALVMADVSGKGVPAALFMMVSKAILKNNAMMGKSAGEILTAANDTICSNNKMQMFVTVWLGILEISTGRIVAANAGHEYPVIYRSGGTFEPYRDRHGFVVGGMEGLRYREYELRLQPGDKLFLYTDGVPEATDDSQELFGMKRMLAALCQHAGDSPQDILYGVRAAVDAFVGDAEQFDDLTMLCLEYKGCQRRDECVDRP